MKSFNNTIQLALVLLAVAGLINMASNVKDFTEVYSKETAPTVTVVVNK